MVIFFQSKNYRLQEFTGLLRKEAISAANIFFNQKAISSDILKLLDRNNYTVLADEEVVIFDENYTLIYETGDDNFQIPVNIFEKIKSNKEYYWQDKGHEFLGIKFENKNQNYLVIAYATDHLGLIKLKNLECCRRVVFSKQHVEPYPGNYKKNRPD
jgi:hypothetical protein